MGAVLRDVEWEFGTGPTRLHLVLSLTDEFPPVEQIATAHCLAFEGDALVLARHVDRAWTIPGGHLEPGESVEEGLRREAREEAGIEIGQPTLIAVERCDRIAGPAISDRYSNPSYQTFFVAPLVSLGEPTALEECTESRLFTPDEARVAPGWVQDLPALYEAALAWTRDCLCRRCGFVYDESTSAAAAREIRTGVDEMAALLSQPPSNVATRPSDGVWSTLEYGCHLRDVLLVQRERVLGALAVAPGEDPPWFGMWRDERVDLEGYNDARPGDVARQLVDAAALFANVLDRMGGDSWSRVVPYRFPVACERSLRWVAVHTLHEVRHHLADVRPSSLSSSA